MKIAIEATDKITWIAGVKVRVWNGVTEKGAKCLVFVHQNSKKNWKSSCRLAT